jgi:hypothetical protein
MMGGFVGLILASLRRNEAGTGEGVKMKRFGRVARGVDGQTERAETVIGEISA